MAQAKDRAPSGPRGSARDDEFAALLKRGEVLAKRAQEADDDQAWKLEDGPWAELLQDLDGWQKKHKIKLKKTLHEPPSKSGQPIARSHPYCPPAIREETRIDAHTIHV